MTIAGAAALSCASGVGNAYADAEWTLRGVLNDDGHAALDLSSETSALIAVFVEGATVYDARQLSVLYADSLGRPADIAALVELADEITARYREDGYFLSRAVVPDAPLNGGLGRVVVYEGFVSSIRFVGEPPVRARELLEPLTRERPVRLARLEERLTLLRATPGLRVISVNLEPDVDDPRAHVLAIEVRQSRTDGDIQLDNRGSDDYGGWRLTATGTVFGAFTPGDRARARVIMALEDPDLLRAVELSYQAPIGARGTTVRAEIGAGRSIDEGGEVRDLENASIRVDHPVQTSAGFEVWSYTELAAHNSDRSFENVRTEDESQVSLAFGLEGRWHSSLGSINWVSQALYGRAASPSDALRSRFDSDDAFARINVSVQHRARFGELLLWSRAALQVGDGPMPRAQEMPLGGRSYGRGYSPGALRGDTGMGASIEARYAGVPNWAAIDRIQPYLFLDGGAVFDGYLGSVDQEELASAGGGVRFRLIDRLAVEIETARTLVDLGEDDWRQNFSLNLDF